VGFQPLLTSGTTQAQGQIGYSLNSVGTLGTTPTDPHGKRHRAVDGLVYSRLGWNDSVYALRLYAGQLTGGSLKIASGGSDLCRQLGDGLHLHATGCRNWGAVELIFLRALSATSAFALSGCDLRLGFHEVSARET
jgi:hypothetical protein